MGCVQAIIFATPASFAKITLNTSKNALLAQQEPERLSSLEPALPQEELTATELNTTNYGSFLEVSKDKLTVVYTGSGHRTHDNDVGSIQGNRPVPRRRLVYYFELIVENRGSGGFIGIGFTTSSFKLCRQPGWEPHSWGYHGDDGKKFGCGQEPEAFGPTFTEGDIVGAGIHLERQEMFFTKNGKRLGIAFHKVFASEQALFPTVGLHSHNESVTLNFGQKPYRFDIQGYIQEERQSKSLAVQGTPVPAGVSHQLVRDYLLYYGYADTLQAFEAASGLDPGCEAGSSERGIHDHMLELRQEVRQLLREGQVLRALERIGRTCREVVTSTLDHKTSAAWFYLRCQHFIELIRQGELKEAVDWASNQLAPLQGQEGPTQPGWDAMLRDLVALLAYEDPAKSPLRELMSQAQREATADAVNAAIMMHAGQGSFPCVEPPPEMKQSGLETVLRQLVAVQAKAHEANGGHGEAFKLSHHFSR
ncbi:hypothetical protein WJX84_006280 [Apatococcus fuscideae]|uniref:Ran-binding protein 10 n=1 Tax=Apatococcus fuscideae TaxID=2026836 RepID=A0AAW1T198_9CHLO